MSEFGNLQKIKDGKRTFAITPHIPGGFITADNLIKIGEVTKKIQGSFEVNFRTKDTNNKPKRRRFKRYME